jgi:hypothetical protein
LDGGAWYFRKILKSKLPLVEIEIEKENDVSPGSNEKFQSHPRKTTKKIHHKTNFNNKN